MFTTIGLDMSISSPAMCIITADVTTLVGFCQRKREEQMSESQEINGTHMMLLPRIPNANEEKNDMVRYNHIVDNIMNAMGLLTGNYRNIRVVYIEDHAYGAEGGHSTKLHELVGIMKYELYRKSIRFEVIGISRWKKYTTGKGNSKKPDVLRWAEGHLGINNILNIYGLRMSSNGCNVPHPVEDMCDALGIAMGGILYENYCTKNTVR